MDEEELQKESERDVANPPRTFPSQSSLYSNGGWKMKKKKRIKKCGLEKEARTF